MNKYEKALKALDGMKQIVKNEMLIKDEYVTPDVINEQLAKEGAICGGHKACAVGSLWIGGGVKMRQDEDGDITLPGTDEAVREEFLRNRPGLRLAYEALNTAAERFAAKRGLSSDLAGAWFNAPIEALFESTYGNQTDDKDMLQIINNAKRIVRSAQPN